MRSTLLALAIALLALPGLFAASTTESAAVEDTGAQMTDGFAVYATQADYEQATGNTITTYGEAPMLAAMVAAGELPPVQERLPEEPLVLQPLASIGRYGGNLIGAANYPTYGADDVWSARIQGLLKPSMDLATVVPNAARAWQASDDLRSLTLHLRRGMKWSDGHPFTADDVMFWYDDYLGNDEINPVKPKMWSPGGELMTVEKLDDLTVRYSFAAPFPGGTVLMAAVPRDGNWTTFAPRHYLEQFHISYNPEANDLAKEAGLDNWYQLLRSHWGLEIQSREDVDLPSIDTWVLDEVDAAGNKYFTRNPYYWKIDTAGNQLPYIDEQTRQLFDSMETIHLQVINGELSYAAFHSVLNNYPLYKSNEAEGGYRVLLWKSLRGAEQTFYWNQTSKDPVLREIFNDIRFRQATSLAINRDEINDSLFFGRAVPRQATVNPDNELFEPWMADHYAEYDPDRANELLDEMGLQWDADGEYRLRPDGKRIAVVFPYRELEGPKQRINELAQEYWKAIGIDVTLKQVSSKLFWEMVNANEVDLGGKHLDMNTVTGLYSCTFCRFRPSWGVSNGRPWQTWYNTDGAQGEEPPPDVKELFELSDRWLTMPPNTDEWRALGKELMKRNVEGMYQVGTVGMGPQPVLVADNLHNIPDEGSWWYDWFAVWFAGYHADQWYFSE
ncbi:MAG: ABC transporter substrate-binding protein [Spirochaetaceae bacterium]|nr:ABC transporter substrate-binding protein [Spirochaetaceae bacterium]